MLNKFKTPKSAPLVKVTWLDATQDDAPDEPAWKDMDESKEVQPATITSVGFLIAKRKTHIVLAQSIAADTQTQGRFMIPTAFVRNIEKV
jgi:hypothetical protein